MKCYYCDAKPVCKDELGYVYVHNAECPVLEREVNAMAEDKTPMADEDRETCQACNWKSGYQTEVTEAGKVIVELNKDKTIEGRLRLYHDWNYGK